MPSAEAASTSAGSTPRVADIARLSGLETLSATFDVAPKLAAREHGGPDCAR